VASRQQAKNRAWVAKQPRPVELTAESRRTTLMYPDLSLRVWCNALGINIVAHVDRSDSAGRIHRTEIAKATWRGKPPTEADVVLWASLALARWLEGRILELGDAELSDD
jgi:hypothetical protein